MIRIPPETCCHCGEALRIERAGITEGQFVLFLKCDRAVNEHHYVGLISAFNVLYHVIEITQQTLLRDFTEQ